MLSGADFSNGMGMLGKGMVHSIESLVVDSRAASYLNRMMQGFQCGEENLAVDIYKEVKPMGSFLSTKHTFEHFRTELWKSRVSYKKSYSSWVEDGRKNSMKSNVNEFIEAALESHQSPEIPGLFFEFDKVIGK